MTAELWHIRALCTNDGAASCGDGFIGGEAIELESHHTRPWMFTEVPSC